MTDQTEFAAFSDAEMDRLDTLLAAPNFDEKAYPLDALQGFLCAVLSGPNFIPAGDWMAAALGGTPRYASDEQADEIEALLQRFHDSTAEELRSEAGLALILYPLEEGGDEFDYGNWCMGYLEGVELGEPAWSDGAGDELDALLLPFLVLTGELTDEAREELGLAEDEEQRIARDARENFVQYVIDVHDYWMDERYKPQTFQREAPKVGRNDPCPCGSGRKYKSCHGAA